MNGRQSLHSRILELTIGEASYTSDPRIDTFEVEDQSLEDTMEEKFNRNQNFPINQAIKRMKLGEYSIIQRTKMTLGYQPLKLIIYH